MPLEVLINQSTHVPPVLHQQIIAAIEAIARDFGWIHGQISVAIVDDHAIHDINRQYLQHDYPTDVISFDLTETPQLLEGEIIASWETAHRVSEENGWDRSQELLLYVIHGMLHIVGLDDVSPSQTQEMREKERFYMHAISGDAPNCN